MRTYQTTLASLLLAALMWPAAASAQNVKKLNNCKGVVSGSYADVFVKNGKTCTLDGATVFGSVLVETGGILKAENVTTIFGSIQVKSGGAITLTDTEVSGDVKLENSGDLTVNAGSSLGSISVKDSGIVTINDDASTGELLVENSDGITINGCLSCGSAVAAILSTKSGDVTLTDARVFPGGVTMVMGGSLDICGSEIGISSTGTDGSGGVTIIESNPKSLEAAVSADGSACAASQIEGAVIVEKGTGNVEFIEATLQSDLIVIDQIGDVLVDGGSMGNGPLVSDVKIEKTTGSVRLKAMVIDSDITIVENGGGNVLLSRLITDGDTTIEKNDGRVDILNNSFSLEDVSVSNNVGPVVIDGNDDLRLTATENDDVTITGNSFTDADVSKNGDVTISGNTGESLVCSDNASVGGGGNNIDFIDGQCLGAVGNP